jgi:hypothetical protein
MDEEINEAAKKMYREFTVTPGMVGFRVKIGCSEAYFGDAPSCLEAIDSYLKDPQETERQYQQDDQRGGGMIAPPTAGERAEQPQMEGRGLR